MSVAAASSGQILYDLSAERDLIALLIREEGLAKSAFLHKRVTRDFFRDLFYLDVFDYLEAYYFRHRLLPSRKEMLRGVPKFMTRHSQFKKPEVQIEAWRARVRKIYNIEGKPERFETYIESLSEHRKARLVRDLMVTLKNSYDAAEYDKAISKATEIIGTGNGQVVNNIVEGDIVSDYREHKFLLREARAGKDQSLATRIPIFFEDDNNPSLSIQATLDDLIDGGFYGGELCVAIGELNVGKSFFLMECGYGAARYGGKNVAFCTIEMSKVKQQRRIYSRMTRIPYNSFKSGALTKTEEEVWRRKLKWWKNNCGIFHVISYPQGCTVTELAATIKEVEKKYGIKFDQIVVDYMNDMRPPNNFSNRLDWDAQGAISWEMAALAKSWNNGAGIPIVTAIQRKHSQIHKGVIRSNEGAFSPLPSDHATIGIGMSQTIEDEIAGKVRWNIWKNRDGEKGQVFFTFPNFKISMISSIRAAREYYGDDGLDNV